MDTLTLLLLGAAAYFLYESNQTKSSSGGVVGPMPGPIANPVPITPSTPNQAAAQVAVQTGQLIPGAVAVSSQPPSSTQTAETAQAPPPPAPVDITVPSTSLADYSRVADPTAGPTFTDTQVSNAVSYEAAGLDSDIAPYMANNDYGGFLTLYFQTYDPMRNPILAQQMANTPQGQQVYAYYNALVAAAPGLTDEGLEVYYTLMPLQGFRTVEDFINYCLIGIASGNSAAAYNAYFVNPIG